MPIYTYACPHCRKDFDDFFRLNEAPDAMDCPTCGTPSARVISFQGGLKTENASWIDHHLRGALQDDGEKPIETRKDYNEYLKTHDIVECG